MALIQKTKQDSSPQHLESNLIASVDKHLHAYFIAHNGDLPAPGLYKRFIHEVERPLLKRVLSAVAGNQVRASEILGINRNTLRKKMQELNIQAVQKS